MITRFDRESLSGFVSSQSFLQPSGVELLSLTGTVSLVPYDEVKVVYFIREFQTGDASREPKVFLARPKIEGLWVRMQLRDGDTMDGLLPNNLLQLEQFGFLMAPPNPSSNNQRIFVPRAALKEMRVLGVVGGVRRQKRRKGAPEEQLEMFP